MINLAEVKNSLKADWRKYAIIGLVGIVALHRAFVVLSEAVHKAELTAQSILHLSPRRFPRTLSGGSNIGNKQPNDTNTEQPYQPPEGKTTITPIDKTKTLDQVVTIHYQEYGLIFEPGVQATAAPLGLGLDIKFAFAHRFGLVLGINYFTFYQLHDASPTLGLTYHLGKTRFRNTDMVIGYAPVSFFPIYGGFRLGF